MRATAQQIEFIQNYLTSLFGSDLHVKRVGSVANAVLVARFNDFEREKPGRAP